MKKDYDTQNVIVPFLMYVFFFEHNEILFYQTEENKREYLYFPKFNIVTNKIFFAVFRKLFYWVAFRNKFNVS